MVGIIIINDTMALLMATPSSKATIIHSLALADQEVASSEDGKKEFATNSQCCFCANWDCFCICEVEWFFLDCSAHVCVCVCF
eukprot:c22141_g1_i3 orf=1-246(-)